MSSDDPEDDPQEKGILAPDELDITDHPKVESLSEGRYVVSPDDTPVDPDPEQQGKSGSTESQLPASDDTANDTDDNAEESAEGDDDTEQAPRGSGGGDDDDDTAEEPPADTDDDSEGAAEPPAVRLTQQTVSQFLAESLTSTETAYGFDATVNIEGSVKRGRMSSDDVAETLEGLLRWYASQTTDEMEPEAALGIILAGSTLEVEYPVQSVYAMLKRYGLQPDDSISDLLSAIREEGSFTVPPSENR
ncbi:hypothetical protein DM826_11215 [Halonotius aquaticus]|uniref:Uncharacterized protein n=1 Tax=Halonotius aquaticus TaxID=2216978 RepID=A0A3A6PL87_9EURY|nr:hypothetical protein [Halonotius aquaticus]RJX42209.1 hypothetical protein DM826_11215 [Halonotius aquaticus]